jgi:signal transduction histidine kinase
MTVCEPIRRKHFAPWRLFLAGIVLASTAAAATDAVDPAPLPVLTNAQQVLDLGLDRVRRSLFPVRLRGVVTFSMEGSVLAYVQDPTAGIQISHTNTGVNLRAGESVEVNGLASAALFAPMVVDADVRSLGTAPMPEPRRVPAARLAAGDAFGQWVAIEGVIRDVAWNAGKRFLFVSSGGLRFHTVMQPCAEAALPANWIDARVELRGVCWTDADRENKPTGFTLYMPGTNHMAFHRPGPGDPFSQPALSVARHSEVHRQSDDRVKIAGRVLFHAPGGTVYLRTDDGAAEARLLVPLARVSPRGRYLERAAVPSLQPGARIEVIGAPTNAVFAPVLHDAELRVVGEGSAPTPVVLSVAELSSGRCDRELVSVKARLLAQTQEEIGASRRETFLLQSGDTVFEATLAPGATHAPGSLPKNCYLEVAGLCLAQAGELPGTRSFRLLIRDPAELRVVGQWSAWRSPEALRIAAVAGTLGLAALGWIWLLRKQVAERTAALATANRSLQSEVDERKRAQADLGRALEAEKDLGQLKSRFVSLVSHEFRTPLGIIMSAADILRNYAERLAPERRTEHLQEIHDATKHMAGMMEQVLLLGRAESGRIVSNPAPIDLGAFCQKLMEEQRAATNRRCPIQFTGKQGHAPARGDAGLLRHIFNNLLSNAVKYSPEGGAVEFSLERVDGDAVFRVLDHGIGIPAADAARLFTAFHRCANVGEAPGTGLGLLIVKRCVDLHGGDISFESREGRGTTFTVRLPLFGGDNSEQV